MDPEKSGAENANRKLLHSFFYPEKYENNKDVPAKKTENKRIDRAQIKHWPNLLPGNPLKINNQPQKEQYEKETHMAKMQELSRIYQERSSLLEQKRKNSPMDFPDDGLPNYNLVYFANKKDKATEYNIEIYNLYKFEHRYDQSLPVIKEAKNLLRLIETNDVCVVSGATGSGKTTQLPQLLLDSHRACDKPCNIIITQPRRIAAVSVAKRVCAERGWNLGELVGYSIAHDRQTSPHTRICYVTIGVLIERIIHDMSILDRYTHIIIDEVHERSVEVDMLLLIIRRFTKEQKAGFKLILMSATIDNEIFSRYFSSVINNTKRFAPSFSVQGRLFKVNKYYLEEFNFVDKQLQKKVELIADSPVFDEHLVSVIVELVINMDKFEDHIYKNVASFDRSSGSVLVFVPGVPELEEVHERLVPYQSECKIMLRKLHSLITIEEQAQAFKRCELNWRKVIIATNVAESSITVPDVNYVIDSCLHKQQECDQYSGLSCLTMGFVSKSSAKQRAGRAGRVSTGHVFRLVTRDFYKHKLEKYGKAEILRVSLEQVILKAKQLDLGPPLYLLSHDVITKPNKSDLLRSIITLKEIGAITLNFDGKWSKYDGELTTIGSVMSALPIDIRLGKFICFANMFNLLDEAVVIAAAASVRNLFVYSNTYALAMYIHKFNLSNDAFSDHIAHLQLFNNYLLLKKENGDCNVTLRNWSYENYVNLKALIEMNVVLEQLCNRLDRLNMHFKVGTFANDCFFSVLDTKNVNRDRQMLMLKVCLAASVYPNYFCTVPFDLENAKTNFEEKGVFLDYNPFNSIKVTGIDPNQNNEQFLKRNFAKYARIKSIEAGGNRAVINMLPRTGKKIAQQQNLLIPAFNSKKISVLPDIYLFVKMRRLHYNYAYSDEKNDAKAKKLFNGPFSDLEMRFVGLTKYLSFRSVKIDPNSVNSVALYQHDRPNLKYSLVSTDLSVTSGSFKSAKLRSTTVLPPFPGLMDFICLFFTPRAQLIRNENENDDDDEFVGALCGLGADYEDPDVNFYKGENSAPPSHLLFKGLHPDNDIYLNFELKMTTEDMAEINAIRDGMNFLLDKRDFALDVDHFIKLGDMLGARILNFLSQRREPSRNGESNEINDPDRFYWRLDQENNENENNDEDNHTQFYVYRQHDF